MFWYLLSCSAVYCLLISSPLAAQSDNETGRFYIRNFGFKEYDAHQQNWAIVQDQRGILYVGNNWGVLEYDGISWRHIVTDKNSAVIAMDIDSTGAVYVGAEQGLGYLAPDSLGQMQFVSLEDRIPEDQRDYADVWRVHATRHGVYFFTVNKLFLWANNVFQVWPIAAHSYSQVIGDAIYFAQTDIGLMRADGAAPVLVAGGEKFARERMDTMFPYDDNGTLLVGTRGDALFLYDGATFKPFKTGADDFLKANLIYSGARLPDEKFAFGTIRGGLAIIDAQGNWLHKLDTSTGLRDQTVIFTFVDRTGDMWLSFLNGIAHVETATPFTRFNSDNGLEGGVESIRRHDGRLYVATHHGVHYLDAAANSVATERRFSQVADLETFCWSLHAEDNLLLAATDEGVYEIKGTRARPVESAKERAFSFYRPAQQDYLLLGLRDGLAVLKQNGPSWQNLGRVQDINVEIRSITADENSNLWLGTNVNGAFLVENLDLTRPPGSDKNYRAKVTNFGEDVLPVGEINVFNIGGRVLLGTERGIRYFDAAQQAFARDATFGADFADNERYIGRIVEQPPDRVWIFSRKDKRRMVGFASQGGEGAFAWQRTPFQRIADVGIIYAIYPEESGSVWIGGTEGLARYDAAATGNLEHPFQTVIRRVAVDGDSVIYGGARAIGQETEMPVLPYSRNAMRFVFAASSYHQAQDNQYQYLLEGFDEDWSDWSTEVRKDYTNLPEGDYRFHVRGQSIYGAVGQEDVFEFTIRPPWYRSWWAYLLYVLTFAVGLIQLVRVQSDRHRRQAEQALQREKERANLLEANLRAEAAELRAKAAWAEKEREKEQMRSRIASDLHDEIGSNLGSISVISQMLQSKEQFTDKEKQRLRDVQNIAQNTSGSMRDIVWFVNPMNDSLEKLFAKMRETANLMLEPMDFTFTIPETPGPIETDLDFRRNLFLFYKESLQNIVKHAQATKVEIAIEITGDGVFVLRVSDNGIGFDPAKNYAGDGLKNFASRAQALGGSFHINSSPARGTEIILEVATSTSKIP